MSACKKCGGRLEIVGDILNPMGMRCTDCGTKPDPIVASDGRGQSKVEDFGRPPNAIADLFQHLGAAKSPLSKMPPEEGETCRICHAGIIHLMPTLKDGGCSCHLAAPCSYCMSFVPTCLVCGYQGEEP
jgi:hypothetical protein